MVRAARTTLGDALLDHSITKVEAELEYLLVYDPTYLHDCISNIEEILNKILSWTL